MMEWPPDSSQMNGWTSAMATPLAPRFGARWMSRLAPRVPV